MEKSSTLYVDLDVHKDSIDIATADPGRDSEVRHVGTIGGDLAALVSPTSPGKHNCGSMPSSSACWHAG